MLITAHQKAAGNKIEHSYVGLKHVYFIMFYKVEVA